MRTLPSSVALTLAGFLAGAASAQPSSSWAPPSNNIDAIVEFDDLRGVALDDVALGGQVHITGVSLAPRVGHRAPAGGHAPREATLTLERFTVLNPGAIVCIEGPEGRTAVDTSSIVMLGGRIEGEADSLAYIGISDAGIFGFVHAAEGTYAISSGPADVAPADRPLTIAHAADLPAPDPAAPFCGYRPGDPRLNPAGIPANPITPPKGSSRAAVCRSVDIAIDTDWEYTQRKFGSNPNTSAQYAVTLLGAVSQIYKSELNVRLTTNFVRTWSADTDPYHLGGNLLDEFSAHWGSNMGAVPRELAHLLSGNYGGGVAYLSAICEGWGYGLSGVDGSFPSPLQNRHHGNWDLMVVAHELGHNFGTGHTHDSYTPVIDGCGNGDCSQALGGTIMSYCHTCAGGMSNIDLLFGPRVQERIWEYLDTRACVLPAQGDRVAVADSATVIQGGVVDLHVLNNDSDVSCLPLGISTYQPTSTAGGVVTIVPAIPGPTQHLTRSYLRYTAPASFSGTDTFTYTVTGGSTATVTLDVLAARPGENPSLAIPGVDVRYFALPGISSLPNYALIPSYIRDNVGSINFTSTTGAFATSGRTDNVGAVFDGFINITTPGLYTISLSSDDGSKLFLGDTLLINHDGLHGMSARSASLGLAAGAHRTRIEYFERTGSAGLILSLQGPGLPLAPIPASMWTTLCPADTNASGDLDILDFLDFIDAFGSCSGSANGACNVGGVRADFNGDGAIDIVDFLDFLDAFGSGC